MSSRNTILSIKSLTKRYENDTAVDNVSLDIERGSFFGLLGKNGAGKSTIIHCITGIANITNGTILVDGVNVKTEYKIARTKVGLSPQEFNVDIFATVYQLLDYMGGYYGMRKHERDARIKTLLEQFDLQKYAKIQFMKLSGGLKRRAILARALMHQPPLLILDEPTAGVDVEQRKSLWEYLRLLNKNGTTIILTSHYLEEIEALCDEIAILHKGKLLARGEKSEFLKDGSLEDKFLTLTK